MQDFQKILLDHRKCIKSVPKLVFEIYRFYWYIWPSASGSAWRVLSQFTDTFQSTTQMKSNCSLNPVNLNINPVLFWAENMWQALSLFLIFPHCKKRWSMTCCSLSSARFHDTFGFYRAEVCFTNPGFIESFLFFWISWLN